MLDMVSGSSIDVRVHPFTVNIELVLLLIVICILTLVQFVDTNHVAFFSYIYIYRIYIYTVYIYIYIIYTVYRLVLQVVIYCMVER